MSQIDQEMWQDFVIEAEENLQEIEPNLLLVEQESDNISLLNDCFRNMHSIKGAANYMGLSGIATLSHRIETLFDKIRQGEITVDYRVMDAILAGTDRIRKLTGEVAEEQKEKSEITDVLEQLDQIIEGRPAPSSENDNKNYADGENESQHHEPEDVAKQDLSESGPVISDEPDEDPELLAIYREEMTSLYEHLVNTSLHGSISYQAVQEILENMARVTNYVARDHLLEQINAIREKLSDREKQDVPAAEAAAMILRDIEIVLSEDLGDAFSPAAFNEPATSTSIEEDEELYSIFLDFVREVAWPLANIPSSYSSKWLEVCQESVEKIKVSANYMDYTEITALLEEWEEILVQQLTHKTLDATPLNELWKKFVAMLPGLNPDDPAFTTVPDDFESEYNEDSVHDEETEDIHDHVMTTAPSASDNAHDDIRIETAGPIEEDILSMLAGGDVGIDSGPSRAEQDILEFERDGVSTADRGSARKTEQQSVRVDIEKIEDILEEVGELVILRSALSSTAEQMKNIYGSWMERHLLSTVDIKPFKEAMLNLTEQASGLERVIRQLQDGVMRMRMFPIDNLFNRFPRMVRDLSHKLGRDVELVMEGTDTDLDKRVMEQMADPLQHIIRNAISHGIEESAERRRSGKPSRGTIRLSASQEGNSVIISITDDGRGLDRQAITVKAIEKGLISEADLTRLEDADVWDLIFVSGISTASEVSEEAGRGVGMDVVRQNVEKIGGSISIRSVPGRGTSIRIRIPLTLAIIHALLVQVGRQKMAIPLAVVQETFRIFEDNIGVADGHEIISVRQDTMPFIRLANVFMDTGSDSASDRIFVVRIQQEDVEACLGVDALLGQQEIVIKPLAEYLTDQPGFSGSTVLGDGSIALILDTAAIMERARQAILKRRA